MGLRIRRKKKSFLPLFGTYSKPPVASVLGIIALESRPGASHYGMLVAQVTSTVYSRLSLSRKITQVRSRVASLAMKQSCASNTVSRKHISHATSPNCDNSSMAGVYMGIRGALVFSAARSIGSYLQLYPFTHKTVIVATIHVLVHLSICLMFMLVIWSPWLLLWMPHLQ